ncbi:MAG: OmpA family protein [candidate division WOR-3 bacterium]|nr:OmpA family protein [candidate division WOR-3 bacterium]
MERNAFLIPIVISVFLLWDAPAQARPNHWAQNGALDVFYAPAGEQGLLSFSVVHVAGGYSNEIYGHDYSAIGFAPLSFMEFSAAVYADGFRSDDDHYLIGPVMLSPALKTGYAFYLGSEPNEKEFFLAPGLVALGRFATASVWSGDSTSVSAPPPSVDFTGILGIGYDIFKFHINAGYGIFINSGIASIPWGVAVEVSPLQFLDVVLEATNRSPAGDILSFDALQVTPLVRMNIPSVTWLTFDLAVPIGIGSELYPWKIELGISAGFDLIQPPKISRAHLLGRVVDEETADPLAARLIFPEAGMEPVMTDSATGDYSVELATGVYRVRAESPGYKWKEKGVVLQDGDQMVLDFSLAKERRPQAQLSGTVKDTKSGEALERVFVSFGRTDVPEVTTDALGIYKAALAPGDYQITFTREGYEPERRSLSLKDGEARELNMSLSPPEPARMPEFENVGFNPGSAVIVPESYAALEEAARFLETYPRVRIEIEGHTDSVGEDEVNMRLSQQRAEAVKTWLEARGIDESRMTARGYGETRPVGDNRTRSGQKANRRIEFVILSE